MYRGSQKEPAAPCRGPRHRNPRHPRYSTGTQWDRGHGDGDGAARGGPLPTEQVDGAVIRERHEGEQMRDDCESEHGDQF